MTTFAQLHAATVVTSAALFKKKICPKLSNLRWQQTSHVLHVSHFAIMFARVTGLTLSFVVSSLSTIRPMHSPSVVSRNPHDIRATDGYGAIRPSPPESPSNTPPWL